jgi:3-hydroxybutyryl-CoA dehydrogenase
MKIEEMKNVAIIGSGTMGAGLAQVFAQAGLSVRIFDQSQDILDQCLPRVSQSLKLFTEYGLLEEEPSKILSRIQPLPSTDMLRALQDCEFVLECIPEVLALKKELFLQLDACQPVTILSSNTSTFTISSITAGMGTASRVVGTHFFFPPQIIPLVEVHRGKETTDEAVELTRHLLVKAGKKPVLIKKEILGFVVNRIQAAIGREANYLIEQGVISPEEFDLAARGSYGFRMANLGPLEQADLNGLDTKMRSDELTYKELCSSTELSRAFLEKVKRGELGLKSEKGFYDYKGKSKELIIERVERNLLKQLLLFKEREKGVSS